MHKRRETINIDSDLKNILRNEYPEVQNIFQKLEKGHNNLNILSSDELYDLWSCIKDLLRNIKKLAPREMKRNGIKNKTEEHSFTSKIYSSIIKVNLQLLKSDYIPDVLLDVVKLLNSRLPEITDTTVKEEVSSFLEECWKLNLIKEGQTVKNVLKHLTDCSKDSQEHVIRLNAVKSAIHSLKSNDDMRNVMKLARENTLLQISEGRDLIIYLFTIGDPWIMGIYNNIRVSLETAEINCVKIYANMFINAWQSIPAKRKVIETCLENLIYHCLRAKRDIEGRHKLGEMLLIFLESFHLQKNNDIKLMICDQYHQFIWTYLEAPGSCVKCNAAEILFLAYPMIVSKKVLKIDRKLKANKYLTQQHNAITNLLRDSDENICAVALKGTFHILNKFWISIPSKIVHEWLNIALEYTKSSKDPKIRKSVFDGLKQLLKDSKTHSILIEIAPNYVDSMFDTNESVKLSVLELFLEIEEITKIQVQSVVPLNSLINCLEVNSDKEIIIRLHKLLWFRISLLNNEENIINEIINAGQMNINVIRKFFLHSKDIICYESAAELLNILLPTITQIIELLPENEVNRNLSVKKHKPSYQVEKQSCKKANPRIKRLIVNELLNVQILIDVSALLYLVNIETFTNNSFKNYVRELNSKIVKKLCYILENFEDTELSESTILFLSLIPKKSIGNFEEYIEKYKRNLLCEKVSDNTILSILHLLMTWDEIDKVLYLLPSLLSLDADLQQKLVSFVLVQAVNSESEIERQARMLNLGLRILQIIQNNFQYNLMPKYYENMIRLWENLHFIEEHIENKLTDNDVSSALTDDALRTIFNYYISLIPILHSDDFRSETHFLRIINWAQVKIVQQLTELSNLETDELCTDILKCVLNTSKNMIEQTKAPPKLCCEIIILYTKCLMGKCGIVFVNSALVTIIALMKFSSDMFKDDESELLKVVIPSLFVAVMVALIKNPVELVREQTENLKILENSIKDIFPLLGQSLDLRLRYIAIIFNTAVFCFSKDFKKVLNNENRFSEDILDREFPFIAKEIIKIILHGEGFQDLCIDVLNKTYSKYSTMDQLSSLMIIRRLIKARNKSTIKKRKRIKNIMCLIKEQDQVCSKKNFVTSVRDKFVCNLKKIIIEELLHL